MRRSVSLLSALLDVGRMGWRRDARASSARTGVVVATVPARRHDKELASRALLSLDVLRSRHAPMPRPACRILVKALWALPGVVLLERAGASAGAAVVWLEGDATSWRDFALMGRSARARVACQPTFFSSSSFSFFLPLLHERVQSTMAGSSSGLHGTRPDATPPLCTVNTAP